MLLYLLLFEIRIYSHEMMTNGAKIFHESQKKQLHELIFSKDFCYHSMTFLCILMRHSTYKGEKYTFVCVNIQVVKTIFIPLFGIH